ncbi:MAG: tetratricopeptide repeat protein [Opitutales bacterium]
MPLLRSSLHLAFLFCILAAATGRAEIPAAVQRLLEEEAYKNAAPRLAAYVEEAAEDREARQTLVSLLMHLGEPEMALEVLATGLRDEPGDLLWWGAIGEISYQLAQDGPGVTRQGGMVSFSPRGDLSEEAIHAFQERYAQRALEAFRAGLRIDPRATEMLAPLTEMAEMAGEEAIAIEVLEAALEHPSAPHAWVHGQLAHFHLVLDDVPTARRHAEQSMAIGEGSAAAAKVLSRLAGDAGEIEEASRWEAVGDFLSLRPSFLDLPYSPTSHETLRLLAQTPTPEMKDLEQRLEAARENNKRPEPTAEETELDDALSALRATRHKDLVNGVHALIETPSAESSQLLAALAYFHTAHGAIEDSAFAELARRGDSALIKALMEEAGSVCTLRGGAAALVQMRDPEAFERIAPLLPMDTGMWPIHAARALGDLGDRRAAPLLAQIITEPRPGVDVDSLMAGFGLSRRREEAALALGKLDSPTAHRALEESEKSEDLRPFVTAALLRTDATGRRWKWLHRWAKKEERSYDLRIIVDYLREASLPAEDLSQLEELASILAERFPREADED